MLLRTSSVWMIRRLARQPMAWICASLALAIWPMVVVFSPISLTMTPRDLAALAVQAGWLGALGAQLLALRPLGESEWIFQQSRPTRGLWARLFALALTGGIGFLLAIAGAALFGGPLELPWPRILLAGTLSVAHLVTLSWLCLALRVPQSSRSLCLVLSAWVLPSLAGGVSGPLGRAAAALETQHTGQLLEEPTLTGVALEALPILLVALAALMAGSFKASPHPPAS